MQPLIPTNLDNVKQRNRKEREIDKRANPRRTSPPIPLSSPPHSFLVPYLQTADIARTLTTTMKIIDKHEIDAHKAYVLAEGAKGLFYGSVLSLGLFAYLKTRHPARFARFNTSLKTAILVMPTISVTAFLADQGSVEFDRQMYQAGHTNKQMLDEYKQWQDLPLSEKIVTGLATNKYKIVLSAWLASMYGLWVFVNRDKVMPAAQKLVQARMYAQAITIVLLLSTLGLAMKEAEINKDKPKPIPEWKKYLMEHEGEKQDETH